MTSAPEVDLTHDEVRRCSRHLVVPEVGLDGQRALKQARVLLVGAGGLGSPTAMYLAAAGVGAIGIVDGDVVDAGDRIFAHSRARTLGSSLVSTFQGHSLGALT